MRILLIGYGKMGKAIESIALERGHTIVGKIDVTNIQTLSEFNHHNTDAAIEFTQPESAPANVSYCLENGIPIVCGTTGWLEHKPALDQLCADKKGAFFYTSNYSIGVNLFFKMNEEFAKIMSDFPDFKISMEEIHHIHKKDAPSGTAITLAEGILKNYPLKSSWKLESESQDDHALDIKAIRKEEYPGTHTVKYISPIDSIELTHTAFNRTGFASGAVLAAEYLQGKSGLFSMRDMLRF
jgi:4-hydroxy-tetrahydrodipicolinate reductase